MELQQKQWQIRHLSVMYQSWKRYTAHSSLIRHRLRTKVLRYRSLAQARFIAVGCQSRL